MNYKADIERLRKELSTLEAKQSSLDGNCVHDWDETKYEPESYREPVFSHYEGHGSDPNPVYNYYDKTKDRWSRECKKCGKKEYTYTKAPVKYEPKFN